ncbi:MAG: hypothetical protein ACYDBB_09295 [Armatimonadota bacterium]
MRSHRPRIDLTEQLTRVIEDLCARIPELVHINPRRVLMCLTRTRSASPGGTFAKIIPMRFPDASPFKQVNGQQFALPQIPTPDGDVLYLIYVYVPRFFTQPFERRLLTLVHELFHIAPAFDGTIRRFGSRCHGGSRARFNENLQPLLEAYLTANPPTEILEILKSDLKDLSRHASLIGRSLAVPKAVRLG